MKLSKLRISNFQSFGPTVTEIALDDLTFVLGPNGAGKTALLQALSRMFDFSANARRVFRSDFHIPFDETPGGEPEEREFFIEAEFIFPELSTKQAKQPTIPPNFAHMRLETADGPAKVRFRLDATLDSGGAIEDDLSYVIKADNSGKPEKFAPVPRADRNAIHVHYLPARRDPADHISYTAASLIGRLLRAGNWTAEQESIKDFTKEITDCLGGNSSVTTLSEQIASAWQKLHRGKFFTKPEISFVDSQIDAVLRHLAVSFGPGHGEERVDSSRLSDGQKSMLYLAIVLAVQRIGAAVLDGSNTAFDVGKLKPAIFTLVAMEEPENSLSPHYLGRVTNTLAGFSNQNATQAVIATHSPSMLRRVAPEHIRYIRLDESRTSKLSTIVMPPESDVAHKFVREAVQAFPELYFSRLVILGEGDSEEIVLPRVLNASGLGTDESAISVAPLGGRHVNHFWRLLHGLGIPHVTLLDLDASRHQGGWGRIKYAATQLLNLAPGDPSLTQKHIDGLPKWDVDPKTLKADHQEKWLTFLEGRGIFFSAPLDLDLSMIEAFPDAYGIAAGEKVLPTDSQIKAVLGDSFSRIENYSAVQRALFPAYQTRFKLGSKPATHLEALTNLTDDELMEDIPPVLKRLTAAVKKSLESLPE